MSESSSLKSMCGRCWFLLLVMALAFATLAGRAVYLQYYEHDFLLDQGEARYKRVMKIPAHRGMIVDRNGEPLAISTPVDSVWVNPQQVLSDRKGLAQVAKLLGLDAQEVYQRLVARSGKEFVYLRRHVEPELAHRVMEMGVAGVSLEREYRRYYPAGEVAGHVLGFTDIDDHGQEGMELAYDTFLSGKSGAKRVVRDRLGRVIEDVEQIKAPRPGNDLRVSLDRRIQFLAYRELKLAVKRHGASAGSIVVLDPWRGEVLAMVNQPAFNPNNRLSRLPGRSRNRALTDVFEPGSTIKPFTVAAALETNQFKPRSTIDTSPGWFVFRGHTIQDLHDYGTITVEKVISKSSNVGASKIALAIPKRTLWEHLQRSGFGMPTGTGFPGESSGLLMDFERWRPLDHATVAFGYGLSATALQLANAYGVLATDGALRPISLVPVVTPPKGQPVISSKVAQEVRSMLEQVVGAEGTAPAARVEGYRVAGKTGTVHKSVSGGYAKDRYVALFAGMAPASRPALVVVVVINEPTERGHFGGVVAAPAFAKVMEGALRLLNIPPDNYPSLQADGVANFGPA